MDRFVKMVLGLQNDLLADLTQRGKIDPDRFFPVELCLANAYTEAKIMDQPTDQIRELADYVQLIKDELL